MSAVQSVADARIEAGVDEAVYHADPALSQSQLKAILDCPARFHYERTHGRPHKKVYDVGHAWHARALGVGAPIVEVQADDWRTKAARTARDAAHAAGHTPLLTATVAQVTAMHDALMGHPAARTVLEADGESELSAWWTDPETDVPCRARFDRVTALADDTPVIVDLKSTAHADPRRFARSVVDFGYDVQRAMYVAGLGAAVGVEALYVLVVQETEPPYLPAVYTLAEPFVRRGQDRLRAALDLYVQCEQAGHWPGYGEDITVLDAPGWIQ